MPNRLFQGVVHQMRDAADRMVGVIDENAVTIACSELGKVGEVNDSITSEMLVGTTPFVCNGYTYQSLGGKPRPEYAVFVDGTIAEYGNHPTLMQKNGVYAEMYRKQSEGYTDKL